MVIIHQTVERCNVKKERSYYSFVAYSGKYRYDIISVKRKECVTKASSTQHSVNVQGNLASLSSLLTI